MDGKQSIITTLVMSNPEYKKQVLDRMKRGESLVGLKFKVDGKEYIITDGNIDHIIQKVEKFKEEYK